MSARGNSGYFKPFKRCISYTQKDAAGLSFRKVLPEGVISHLDMGLVTAEGPTHKFPGVHSWDQVYLVFRGKGYIHLGRRRIRIDRPGIAVIPGGTRHSVEVDTGEIMEYIYVNRRLTETNKSLVNAMSLRALFAKQSRDCFANNARNDGFD